MRSTVRFAMPHTRSATIAPIVPGRDTRHSAAGSSNDDDGMGVPSARYATDENVRVAPREQSTST